MRTLKHLFAALLCLAAPHAGATFHLWAMQELYSNADGSVQFIELQSITGGQQFLAGHVLEARGCGASRFFTFPSNLPGDSGTRRMLIATQGFAALNVVTPDFTVPNGFFCASGGTVDFAHGADTWNHGPLPTDGTNALLRNGSTAPNSPQNFAGQSGTVSAGAPAVTITPMEVDFGSVAVGATSGERSITFASNGSAAYRITGINSTSGCGNEPLCSGTDFICAASCNVGADIAPGGSCQIQTFFRPTAAGARTANINVCDNIGGGRSVTIPLRGTGTSASSPPSPSVQGLWWRSPAGSENGWGVNITQQGDIIFATWFTYDTDGTGMWLVMSDGRRSNSGSNTFTGTLFRTTGPAFNSNPWGAVTASPVGTGTFTFTDGNNGTFEYTVSGVTQVKPITRQIFSTPQPTCTLDTAGTSSSTFFQDLWWRSPANSESGWGVNITHQGDILFVTWFTYDATGRGMWLVMSDARRTTGNTFAGSIFRTTGPAYNSPTWNNAALSVTPVGTGTLTFTDMNNGSFAYTLNGISQTKAITRQVFSTPATICR